MTIEINDNVRMAAALDQVAKGNFFEALCLFARVDTYESMLNRIGCLCHLFDSGYSLETYRRFLAKYYFTHNCLHDLGKLGDFVVNTLGYKDGDREIDTESFDEKKISADEGLIGDYEPSIDFDYDSFLSNFEEPDDEPIRGFCDVRSTEFFFRMIERIHGESDKGNLKKVDEIMAELLTFDSEDEAVLEGQMLICLAERDYERGAQFAEKLVDLKYLTSYRAITIAVGLLSHNDQRKDALEKALKQFYKFADDINDGDLLDLDRKSVV